MATTLSFDADSVTQSKAPVTRIPYEDLNVQQTAVGSGTSKVVQRGRWQEKEVAVLTLKQGSCDTEASVFARLGRHSALVRFYGISKTGDGRDVIVTELACQGSLNKALERMEDQGESVSGAVLLRIAMQVKYRRRFKCCVKSTSCV